jgi:S-adenosylmethionine synthetase
MSRLHIRTSESVSEGHPDKVADQIADALLDAYLAEDPGSRTAIEVLLGKGFGVVTGEVKTQASPDVARVVRDTIRSVGYTDVAYGFDADRCALFISINSQSPDIAQGVERGGAGDQGMMFGYACDETPEMMPLPLAMAHAMMRRQAEVKRDPRLGFRPDGKCQVTVEYVDDRPQRVMTIVCSCQHAPELTQKTVHQRVMDYIIRPVLEQYREFVKIEPEPCYLINPTGSFVTGGPEADTGLTGRKTVVDTYGGFCVHGGGAFSGKDPTKVDRSGAYMARHVAKCIVAAGLARKVQVALAYAIGKADPIHISVETFGTNTIPEEEIERRVKERFSFSWSDITEHLGLRSREMRYLPTAKNGHFGNPAFPWERTDEAERLKD